MPLSYTRWVGLLKVALPLLALGILSSLIFYATGSRDPRRVPFAGSEAEAPGEAILNPVYRGLDRSGAAITLGARAARPVGGRLDLVDAEMLDLRIESPGGRVMSARAPEGRIDLDAQEARFAGEVRFETSDGMTLALDGLRTRIDRTDAESEGRAAGSTPFGEVTSARLRVAAAEPGGGAAPATVILFQGDVRLIYRPKAGRDAP